MHQNLTYYLVLDGEFMGRFVPFSTAPKVERAILVGVDCGKSDWPLEESMDELERLTQTDGAEVIMRITQKLDAPVPKTFIGKGKTEELVSLVRNTNTDVVIFDDELTPSQQSNLEKLLGEPLIVQRLFLISLVFTLALKKGDFRYSLRSSSTYFQGFAVCGVILWESKPAVVLAVVLVRVRVSLRLIVVL